jgi:hypothetical protein
MSIAEARRLPPLAEHRAALAARHLIWAPRSLHEAFDASRRPRKFLISEMAVTRLSN